MRQKSSKTLLKNKPFSWLTKRAKFLGRSLIFAATISALAIALIRIFVFPLGTMNADELVYQKMSAAFLIGNTKIPVDPVLGVQSTPWLMFNVGSWSVPKYQPLTSIFLMPAQWFGLWFPLSTLAFACTYSIGKLAAAFSASSLKAAWIWNGSTVFIMTASAVLPYVLSLELGILMLLTAAVSTRMTLFKLGILISLSLLCRPMDGLLFAGAAVAILCQRKRLTSPMQFVKLGFAIGLACIPTLLWNWIQTGNGLSFPFTLTSSLDSWGFGIRKVYDADPGLDFTIWNGMEALLNNLGRVMAWTFGGVTLLPLAYLSVRRRYIKYRLSLLVLTLLWLIAYGCFWGSYTTIRFWNGPDYLGPFYWLPISLILALLIAAFPRSRKSFRFLWVASSMVSLIVFGLVLNRNWIMTDSWKTSALLKESQKSESIIKLDKSYTTHIGAPIQLISNKEEAHRFSTDWHGVLAIIKNSTLKTPKIWIAIADDRTRFDYLPSLAPVQSTSKAPLLRFKNANGVQLQVANSSKCVFKFIPPNTTVNLNLSDIALKNNYTGTCSERAEPNEITFNLFSDRYGTIVHKVFSFHDPKSKQYFYAVF